MYIQQGEQLKRKNAVEIVDASPASLLESTRQAFRPLLLWFLFLIHSEVDCSLSLNSEVNNGLKKPELSRNPRYIDTRMNEVYPAKKSRFGKLSGKGNAKVCVLLTYVKLLSSFLILHFSFFYLASLSKFYSCHLCVKLIQ